LKSEKTGTAAAAAAATKRDGDSQLIARFDLTRLKLLELDK